MTTSRQIGLWFGRESGACYNGPQAIIRWLWVGGENVGDSDGLNLGDCLEASSWRRLLAIMASHGLPCSTRWRKAELVRALQAHLSEPANLRQVVLNLEEPARSALLALLQAGGMLPARTFADAFGDVRPHRPWRKGAGEAEPWRNPASPTERLWYLGLLHMQPARPKPGETQYAVLPADLLDELQHLLLPPQTGQPVRLRPRPGIPPDLTWHVALLLATLEAEPVRPLHGRWLPPRLLAALAGRTGLDQADDFQLSRSERRLPYLAFVHYLALAAGLVAGESRLGVTPAGWQWLAADTPARWQMLWEGWLAALSDLALPFRFPWAALTPPARALVLDQVGRLPLDRYAPLAHVVEQSHLHDERGLLVKPWDEEEDVVAALVAGPLFWFGVVDLAEGDSDSDSDSESDQVPSLSLSLSPLGAWLVGLADWGPPAFAAPQACRVWPSDRDLVLVPPAAQPIHLARLAPLCEWRSPGFPALEQQLLLAEERVGQAVARGVELAQIFHYLEDALGRPASRRQRQRLRAWARAGQQVRVRHLTVLETTDAPLMGELRSRKLVRRHLGDALSPTRSVLNPAGLPALLQTLRTLGLYAGSHGDSDSDSDSDRDSDGDQDPSLSLSLLWMAGLVYRGLGAHVPLRVPLSADVMDGVAEQLTRAQREAAEHAAGQVLDQVKAALQGYLGLPAGPARARIGDVVPVIEAALAGGQDLVLTYWGAGREQAVVRRVTPYWVERRGEVPYLVAYCHLRDAERVFRVDRIVECRVYETDME